MWLIPVKRRRSFPMVKGFKPRQNAVSVRKRGLSERGSRRMSEIDCLGGRTGSRQRILMVACPSTASPPKNVARTHTLSLRPKMISPNGRAERGTFLLGKLALFQVSKFSEPWEWEIRDRALPFLAGTSIKHHLQFCRRGYRPRY
jgi:hypothetical protein